MAEGRPDRPSSLSEILAARKRQEQAERRLLLGWLSVMLLVVCAGFLLYIFLSARTARQAGSSIQTPGMAGIISTPSPPATGAMGDMGVGEKAAPSLAPTAASRVITYTVQQGDNLTVIAERFGADLYDLAILNPSITPELIKEGDQLSILIHDAGVGTATPASPEFQATIDYQVAAGDTLVSIAAQFGSTVEAIVRENGLGSADQIREGQQLKIPVPAGASETPEATSTPTPVK